MIRWLQLQAFVTICVLSGSFAFGASKAQECSSLWKASTPLQRLAKMTVALGVSPQHVEILQTLVDSGQLTLSDAKKIVRGEGREVLDDTGLSRDVEDQLQAAFQLPYQSSEPFGRSARFTLPPEAAHLAKPGASVVVREKRADPYAELREGNEQSIAILIDGRPITSLSFEFEAHDLMHLQWVETSSHGRGVGLEAALMKELIRRYSNITKVESILGGHSYEPINPPEFREVEGFRSLFSTSGAFKLKVSESGNGQKKAVVTLKR